MFSIQTNGIKLSPPSLEIAEKSLRSQRTCTCFKCFKKLFKNFLRVNQVQKTFNVANSTFQENKLKFQTSSTANMKFDANIHIKQLKFASFSIERISLQSLNKQSNVHPVILEIQKDIQNNKYHSLNPLANHIEYILKDIDVSDPGMQKDLIILAESQAEKGGKEGEALCRYIKKFCIDHNTEIGQKALARIAKISLEKGIEISLYIHHFQICSRTSQGLKELENIAKLSSEKKFAVSPHIQNYGIDSTLKEGLEVLCNIACNDARNKHAVSPYLSLYGIHSQGKEQIWALIKIAKAEIDSCLLHAKSVQNYGFDPSTIEGQNALIKLAEYHASKLIFTSRKELKELIQIYQIDTKYGFSEDRSWQAAIDIIKQCFKRKYSIRNQEVFNLLMENIQEFFSPDINTLKVQEALIEIAKSALISQAPKIHAEIASNISYSMQQISLLSKRLDQFGIDFISFRGKEALFELAKINVHVCLYLEKYGFDIHSPEGQAKVIELAYFHVKKSSNPLPEKIIQAFPIKEKENVWIEIAIVAALHDPINTIRNLDYYNISRNNEKGRQAWRQILSLAIQRGGLIAFEEYERIYINQEDKIFDYLPSSDDENYPFSLDPETIKYLNHLSEYLKIKNQETEIINTFAQDLPHFPFHQLLKTIDNNELIVSDILKEINIISQTYPYLPVQELETLIKNGNLYLIKKVVPWIISVVICLTPLEEDLHLEIKEILACLVCIRDVGLKYDFSDLLIQIHTTQKLKELITIWHDKGFPKPISENKMVLTSYSLLTLALAIGGLEGQNKDVLIEIVNRLLKLRSGTLILKNEARVKILLRGIIAINGDPLLAAQEKEKLLGKMANGAADEVADACLCLFMLNLLKKQNLLITLAQSSNFHIDLKKIYQLALSEVIPTSNKIDPIKLYHFLAQQFRNPNLFIFYFTQLKKLKEEEWNQLKKPLVEFFEKIFNDQYPNCRYESENSQHLEHVFKYNKHLKEKWIKNKEFPLNKFVQSKENYKLRVVNTDDLCDLLVCGTEVAGSCLNIRGDVKKNKSLLTYMHDGKIRLIAIKDNDTNVIKARALIRVLLIKDQIKQKEEPVLFLEKIYPNNLNKKFMREGILAMAKFISRELGLPLITKSTYYSEMMTFSYPHSVYSLSTRGTPFEYVDAKQKMFTDGKFTLQSLRQIKLD